MTVNRNTQSLQEVEEDIDEIQEDVDELQEDVEDISEDVEEMTEDEEAEEVAEENRKKEQKQTLDDIAVNLKTLMDDVERLKTSHNSDNTKPLL